MDVLLLVLRLAAAVTLMLFVGVATYWLWRDSLQPRAQRPLRLLHIDDGSIQQQWRLGDERRIHAAGFTLYVRQDAMGQWWLEAVEPPQRVQINGIVLPALPTMLTSHSRLDIGETSFRLEEL